MGSEKSIYRINIQKYIEFLYTNNSPSEVEINKTIPFTIASKSIKCLGKHLAKERKDLYSENYKTLVKETEEDTNKWKDISCSQIGRINILKMSLLPKALYKVIAIPVKIPMVFFSELEQLRTRTTNCKTYMEPKKTPSSQRSLEKEQNRRYHTP